MSSARFERLASITGLEIQNDSGMQRRNPVRYLVYGDGETLEEGDVERFAIIERGEDGGHADGLYWFYTEPSMYLATRQVVDSIQQQGESGYMLDKVVDLDTGQEYTWELIAVLIPKEGT